MSKLTAAQYYDFIASDYDEILDEDATNQEVRIEVAQAFKTILEPGSRVLDFGGGTGADWPWLLGNDYDVACFEPSASMQAVSRYRAEYENVRQIDKPVEQYCDAEERKFDGILANFSVLNHIRDIHTIFRVFECALRRNGQAVIVVLNPDKRRQFLLSRWLSPIKTKLKKRVKYKGAHTVVYLHSDDDYINAAGGQFMLSQSYTLSNQMFRLLRFSKKGAG